MSDIAIRVENLSKRYRIGGKQEPYKTLRDSISDFGSRIADCGFQIRNPTSEIPIPKSNIPIVTVARSVVQFNREFPSNLS